MPFASWKKVLVVDLGFLGDTVHSIPALRALALAGKQVDVMTTSVGADLLSLVPEVHKTWTVPLQKPSPPSWKNLGTLIEIRRQKYDAALTWVGSDRNLFCVSASGARERMAHLTGKNSWPSRWGLTRILATRDRSLPVFEQRLSVIREWGWEGSNPAWQWRIPPADQAWATTTASSPFFHLSINAASTPLNEWLLDDWAETLRTIWRKHPGVSVMATGAGSERESARLGDLEALVHDARFRTFPQRLTVAQLAALVQRADLHLGLDSGVLHLAVALDRPTVSLFRESEGRPGWAPRGRRHRVLTRPCPCQHGGQAECEGNRSRCLADIRPAEVAQAVSEVWPEPAGG